MKNFTIFPRQFLSTLKTGIYVALEKNIGYIQGRHRYLNLAEIGAEHSSGKEAKQTSQQKKHIDMLHRNSPMQIRAT